MASKLALKKALFDELKKTNQEIEEQEKIISHVPWADSTAELTFLKKHKDFVQHLIDICVDRNKF